VKIKLQSVEKVLIASAILEVLAYYGYLCIGVPMLAAPTSLQMLGVIWAGCLIVTFVYTVIYLGMGACLLLKYLCEVIGAGDALSGLIKWFATNDRK